MRGRTIAGAVLTGLVVGIGSAVLVVGSGGVVGQRDIGGWRYDPSVGSVAADPYTRAIVAKSGLLALTQAEAIYVVRARDENGRRLSDDCAYRLSAGALPARWWSVTIYAADNFLPVNGDDAQSIDATRVARGAGGGWSARIAPSRNGEANWISSRNAGRFDLQLRLYNPAASVLADVGGAAFPRIETIGCAGAPS